MRQVNIHAAENVLPVHVKPYIDDTANILVFSAVNIWEVSIKLRRDSAAYGG